MTIAGCFVFPYFMDPIERARAVEHAKQEALKQDTVAYEAVLDHIVTPAELKAAGFVEEPWSRNWHKEGQ